MWKERGAEALELALGFETVLVLLTVLVLVMVLVLEELGGMAKVLADPCL